MKKISKTLLCALFMSAIVVASSSYAASINDAEIINTPQELIAKSSEITTEFKEGVHYKVVDGATLSDKKEVREFFSFFCGHCYHFYSYISLMQLALPKDVAFVGNPVHYLGGPMGIKTMKAYATAVSLQVTEQFVSALNKKIFEENKIPQNEDDLATVFEEIGIPKHKFLAQYNSFPVNNMANQYKQKTEDAKIQGVPSVVVNNKYQIVTGSVKGEAEYYALVTYLLNKDDKK